MLEVTAYTGIGPGVHQIVVTACERKVAKAGGDYLRWEFSGHDGKTASANSSVEMTPGNKTGKWFAALTGKATEIGQSRALTEVIGRPGTIVIEINPEGYPKVIALTEAQGPTTVRHAPTGLTVAKDEAPVKEAPDEALSDDLPF